MRDLAFAGLENVPRYEVLQAIPLRQNLQSRALPGLLEGVQVNQMGKSSIIDKLAYVATDSYRLLKTPHSLRKKTAIWLNIIPRSRRFQGFRVSYLNRKAYGYLYREIFARQDYYFHARTQTPLIIDCGANIGMATLYFKWLYPESRVIAFEPDPTTFKVLQANIEANRLGYISAHNCALWSDDGALEFFVKSDEPGCLTMSANRSRLSGKSTQVQKRRLSAFITETVDFLKMDIEGAEHEVLSDLVESGKIRLVNNMVIEYHHNIDGESARLGQFLSTLERAGYDYNIQAARGDGFQDILIACRQKAKEKLRLYAL